jgi:hypothetical protein
MSSAKLVIWRLTMQLNIILTTQTDGEDVCLFWLCQLLDEFAVFSVQLLSYYTSITTQ